MLLRRGGEWGIVEIVGIVLKLGLQLRDSSRKTMMMDIDTSEAGKSS
jgi:hypothetical protein